MGFKRYFIEQGDYPLSHVDGNLEPSDQPRMALDLSRPKGRYDITVRFLGLLEDASPAELMDIIAEIDKRMGYCRPLTVNELYILNEQHHGANVGRELFAIGSSVKELLNGERTDSSWAVLEVRNPNITARSAASFRYPLAIHPDSSAWHKQKMFEGGCNQRIPIVVTPPSLLIGTNAGTLSL